MSMRNYQLSVLSLTFVPLTTQFIINHHVFFALPYLQAHSGAALVLFSNLIFSTKKQGIGHLKKGCSQELDIRVFFGWW